MKRLGKITVFSVSDRLRSLDPSFLGTTCEPIRCRNRLALPIEQIKVNIAGYVSGIPFGGPFSIAAQAVGHPSK